MANVNPICVDLTTGQPRRMAPGDTLTTSTGGSAVPTPVTTFGGDGSLGAITFSASAALSPGVYNYTNVTINPAVVLTLSQNSFNGVNLPAHVHFKCTGNFINSGTIDADGKGWPGQPANNNFHFGLGGAGGGGGGGNGNPGMGFALGVKWDSVNSTVSFIGGGAGGGADNQSGHPGGNFTDWSLGQLGWPFCIPLPGAGGGAGVNSNGSLAGGAGGGCVTIEARGNVTEGTINARGAAGDGSTFSPGGGGGGGGSVFVFYLGTLTTGTITTTGGAGGNSELGPDGGPGGNGRTYRQKVGT